MMWAFVILLLVASTLDAKPFTKAVNCGYQSCPSTTPDELNVHLIAHSHDDVGWLKTVDQYFYGSRSNIQRAGVRYIIDSVIHALSENPNRRFIQVETLFFHDWWVRQTKEKQEVTRKLIENGQFEFIGGGWSMNDEGAAHYQSIIDQFSLGLRFLNSTFGECGRPRIGWQIDPFGHTNEQANIFTQMGFDALFFSRLDYRDKLRREETKTNEMIWQGSSSLGNSSNIFTSILYNGYAPPQGYCFDIIQCQDDPIIDGGYDDNFEAKVNGFADFVREQASKYPTNNIVITMGEDFHFQDALSYFLNMDKLIEGFTKFPQTYEDKKINVFYSTPSCYIKSVNDEANGKKQAFPVKSDDFFPYASDDHAYWTGYFTSRPTSKRFERQGNNLLQILKQLLAQQSNTVSNPSSYGLESALGIMQHHDAITGTEKQHVADDYHRILDEAIETASINANTMFTKLLSKDENQQFDLQLHNCLLANVSVCPYSTGDDFLVAVYNPLSRPVNYHVKLPVNSIDFDIKDPNDESLKYQTSEVVHSFPNFEPSKYELVFLAENIPALGVNVYTITKKSSQKLGHSLTEDKSDRKYRLGNNVAGFNINEASGLLESIIINGSLIDITQEFMYYVGAVGDNSPTDNRSSGAYIFRPSPDQGVAVNLDKPTINTFKGDLFDEVHQTFNSWAKQIIRVYKTKGFIEFDWIVGPIPIDDNIGKEIISRFKTKLNTGDIFYTDSNGKEMVKRIRNHRATYTYTDEEPIAGNYYPVITKISLKDSDVQISLLNDRSQGGSSLKSGEMEVMLHRRLLHDDAKGVGEALNEEQYGQGLVARGSLILTASGEDIATVQIEKDAGEEKTWAPWTFVSDITSKISREDLAAKVNFAYTGLAGTLPDNVKILTLERSQVHENAVLLRLEHIYEVDEHPTLSADVTIDLKMKLFSAFDVISLKETTLDGYLWLEEKKSLDWILGGKLEEVDYQDAFDIGGTVSKNNVKVQNPRDFVITLKPMEIKTFVLFCEYN